MKKLSDISWDIPNDKLINHKFEFQSGESGIVGQKNSIHLQNVIGSLQFLIDYLRYWQHQNYKPSCIYNANKHWVHHEMHIGELCWK